MSLFRPMNSDESNLCTIRLSVGDGSTSGSFNTDTNSIDNKYIVSNNSSYSVDVNHLASPSVNLLPNGFYTYYDASNTKFNVKYGKEFTKQPVISITPHFSTNTVIFPTIKKNSLTDTNNLYLYFLDSSGSLVSPSTDGSGGLLGFDLIITGPVKVGITTGNSNKGWAVSENSNNYPTSVYSYLDINLGSGFAVNNSITVSKLLKLLNKDGNIDTYSSNTTLTSTSYGSSIWGIADGVTLTSLTPQKGMILFIFRTGTGTNPIINLATGCTLNSTSNLRKIEFTTPSTTGSNLILVGTSTTNFITFAVNNVTLSLITT